MPRIVVVIGTKSIKGARVFARTHARTHEGTRSSSSYLNKVNVQ